MLFLVAEGSSANNTVDQLEHRLAGPQRGGSGDDAEDAPSDLEDIIGPRFKFRRRSRQSGATRSLGTTRAGAPCGRALGSVLLMGDHHAMATRIGDSALVGKDQSDARLVPCIQPPSGEPVPSPGRWLAYLLSTQRLDGAQELAFGEQYLLYRHRSSDPVYAWCMVPRIEWLYVDVEDQDPHWVSRGATGMVGLIKVIEKETAVASVKDLYALRASPQGPMSSRSPQSMKIYAAAAMRDLGDATYDEIANHCDYGEERAARRAVQHGRKRWCRLGAWPWLHWIDGRPDPGQWWTGPTVGRTFGLWLADAELAAQANRARQIRWYRLAARHGERTETGFRMAFKNMRPPPRYNSRRQKSPPSEAIYNPEQPAGWEEY